MGYDMEKPLVMSAETQYQAMVAAVGQAIMRACGELPDGFILVLELEQGAASVSLDVPEQDDCIYDFGSDLTLAEEIDNAINTAIAMAEKV